MQKKLIEGSGESDWRNGKYILAISSVIAFVHDIDVFEENCMSIIDEILKCLSYINCSDLVEGEKMNLQNCSSYIEVENTDNGTGLNSTKQLKQRTESNRKSNLQCFRIGWSRTSERTF